MDNKNTAIHNEMEVMLECVGWLMVGIFMYLFIYAIKSYIPRTVFGLLLILPIIIQIWVLIKVFGLKKEEE